MLKKVSRKSTRQRRHLRARKNIIGSVSRPRLSVYRSLHHIYAQIIDDTQGSTLVAASTLEASIKGQVLKGGNIDAAKVIGAEIAKKALDKGITKVVFDRGGSIYHGRIRALAEAAREAGLEF